MHLHSTTSSFAGTYVKKACLSASEKGVCEPCEFDTYTEHGNGLLMCLSCTKCRIGNSGVWKKKKKNTVYILYHTAKSFLFTLRSCKPNQFCVHTIKFLQIYYLTVNCLLYLCTFFSSVDQETTEKCTSTQNTKCQCKQGSFCLPDQACEVCKKCSRYVLNVKCYQKLRFWTKKSHVNLTD